MIFEQKITEQPESVLVELLDIHIISMDIQIENLYKWNVELLLQINGEEFKLVYNSSTGKKGFYLFKNNADLDIATQIQDVPESNQTMETGFRFETGPNNLSLSLFDIMQDYFGVKSESDLHFGEVKLETTNYNKTTDEIATYPVSANEVFTRVFTT